MGIYSSLLQLASYTSKLGTCLEAKVKYWYPFATLSWNLTIYALWEFIQACCSLPLILAS